MSTEEAPFLELVQNCWRQVAGEAVGEPDPDAHLFQSGADSFLFIRLIRKVEAEALVRLPLFKVFQYPSLSYIAKCIQEERKLL